MLKWFARGRLWDSRQEERDDFQRRKERRSSPGRDAHRDKPERRSKDWRPGGDHKDPRARFDKKKRRQEKRAGDERGGSRHPRQTVAAKTKAAVRRQTLAAEAELPAQAMARSRASRAIVRGTANPRPAAAVAAGRQVAPRTPHPQSFKTKWKKDNEPPKKRDKPDDE